MSVNLVWMQTGACGGDSMSLLCAEHPSLENLCRQYDVQLLWHPSLTVGSRFGTVVGDIVSGRTPLDILCIEGSLMTGPEGTGQYDTYRGRAKIDIVRELAQLAGHVVAMGTCAAFGGMHAAGPNPTDCTGLQFFKTQPGGLLGAEWRSRSGQPVINATGCPVHPNTITKLLAMLAEGEPVALDTFNRPLAFFSSIVHQGCTRNEYHEYDIEDHVLGGRGCMFFSLGGRGCMFFSLGCRGPQTAAPCNVDLWNERSSKTRAGVPCFGCTSPDFPSSLDLFVTPKIGDVPKYLPLGVARAKYMAYKNLARAAAPERVVKREMEP